MLRALSLFPVSVWRKKSSSQSYVYRDKRNLTCPLECFDESGRKYKKKKEKKPRLSWLFVYLLGSKAPWRLRTSATMGTVELTGLEMTRIKAPGQFLTIPSDRSRMIPALIYSVTRAARREGVSAVSNLEHPWISSARHFPLCFR
jgi:hypothetical protein